MTCFSAVPNGETFISANAVSISASGIQNASHKYTFRLQNSVIFFELKRDVMTFALIDIEIIPP